MSDELLPVIKLKLSIVRQNINSLKNIIEHSDDPIKKADALKALKELHNQLESIERA